jgi:YD repeat-containing protein
MSNVDNPASSEDAITNVTAAADEDGKAVEVSWDGGRATVERTTADGGLAFKGDGSPAIWPNQESPFVDTTFPAERGAKVSARYKVGETAISDVVTIGGDEDAAPARTTRAATTAQTSDDLDDMSAEDLHRRASDLGIEGRSSLTTKAELIKAIRREQRK